MAPGNPLWIEWLEEWIETAAEEESRSEHAYRKAAGSFKKCPITYNHPQESLELVGVGDHIVSRLTKRLEAYCDENGRDMPAKAGRELSGKAPGKIPFKRKAAGPSKKTKAQEREAAEEEEDYQRSIKRARLTGNSTPPRPAGMSPPRALFDSESDSERLSAKKTRPYIPVKGSGNWGILISMYMNGSKHDEFGWYTKEQIIELATPHSNTSYESGPIGTNKLKANYSAWSGKKALVEKEFLRVNHKRPEKFQLTDSGFELAKKIMGKSGLVRGGGDQNWNGNQGNAQASGSRERNLPPAKEKKRDSTDWRDLVPSSQDNEDEEMAEAIRLSSQVNGGPSSSGDRDLDAEPAAFIPGGGRNAAKTARNFSEKAPAQAANALSHNQFLYVYLAPSSTRTLSRAEAVCKQEAGETFYRVEYNGRQDFHTMARQLNGREKMDRAEPSKGTMSGFMSHYVGAVKAPGLSEAIPAPVVKPVMSARGSLMGNHEKAKEPAKSMYDAPAGVIRSGIDHSVARAVASTSNHREDHGDWDRKGKNVERPPPIPKVLPRVPPPPPQPYQRPRSPPPAFQPKLHPLYCDKPRPIYEGNVNFETETWLAGTFEIILLIDFREIGSYATDGTGTRRTAFIDGFKNRNVLCEQRVLPLGDMVWIARKEVNGRVKEVMLDSIVERKRLDDLVTSIKDGRYHEQKHRLMRSGFENLIYLVESFNSAALHDEHSQQIYTAKSQVQVSSGIALYETSHLNDSLNFLTNRNAIINEIWSRNIEILPDRIIERATYLSLLQKIDPKKTSKYQITFQSFSELNSRNNSLTISQLWGRMLLSISGISAEKACQIISFWPTAQSFFEDCEKEKYEWNQLEEEEKQGKNKFCSDFIVRRVASGRARDVKSKLASDLFDLFTQRNYD